MESHVFLIITTWRVTPSRMTGTKYKYGSKWLEIGVNKLRTSQLINTKIFLSEQNNILT
jgi:hypothetical protein